MRIRSNLSPLARVMAHHAKLLEIGPIGDYSVTNSSVYSAIASIDKYLREPGVAREHRKRARSARSYLRAILK
jgi:hypothetical protein